MLDGWLLLRFRFVGGVEVFDTETGESSIDTDWEKFAVVVAETHSLDLLGVRLNFQSLLHCVIGVTENLNWARTVRFG